MKRAMHRDYFREIVVSRNRFFSILLIILIGVSFFSGIKATGPDMKRTAAVYYKTQNFMDIKLVSSYGVNQNDLECIKQIEGIDRVMPSYTTDALESKQQEVVKVLSIPADEENSVNRLRVIEGRLPQAEGEAVIDERADHYGSYHIGDTILLEGEGDGLPLTRTEFEVVGIVNSPQYNTLERGSGSVGNGVVDYFVAVPEQVFDMSVYTEAYITIRTDIQDIYSDAYTELIRQKRAEIEDALEGRKGIRLQEAKAEGQKEIADGRAELRDAEQQLDDAKQQLADSRAQLDQGQSDYDSSLAEFNAQIAQAEADLAGAKKQLDQGEADYQKGLSEYNAGKQELADRKQQLADGLGGSAMTDEQISSARGELTYALSQIAAGEQQLADKRQQVEDAFAQTPALSPELVADLQRFLGGLLAASQESDKTFAAQQQTLEDALAALPEGSGDREALEQQLTSVKKIRESLSATQAALASGIEQLGQIGSADDLYAEAITQLDQAAAQLADQKKQVQGGLSQLEALQSGQQQLALAEQQLKSAELELQIARLKLDGGKSEYEAGKKELDEKRTQGKEQLDEAKRKLDDGWKEYEDGLAEYEQAQSKADSELPANRQKLADAERKLDELAPVQNYTFDRSVNPGYTSYRDDSDRIDNVATVFPVFFILVAALVCLTTMTRMVEEQRTQIGTLKALGYNKFDIMGKFLLYATLAALIGSVAGLLIGYNLFPRLIFNAYGMLYTMPGLVVSYPLRYSIISIAAALACTTLTAVAVSYSELIPMPASLMRPKTPRAGKKILLERIPFIWNHLSFIVKVTARNLFRYKKRMLMTVIGIAGCTGLMLAGFGIKDSVSGISYAQFGDIYQYDAIAAVDTGADPEELSDYYTALESQPSVAGTLRISQQTVDASGNGRQQSVSLVAPQDPSQMNEFVRLRNEGGPLSLEGEGALITRRLSQLLDVGPGDELTLIDSDNSQHTLRIAAVTEHYVQHYLYLSPSYYQEVFGEAPAYNASLIKLTDAEKSTEEALSSFLAKEDVVQQTVLYGGIRESFDKTIRSLDLVIVVLILAAAALAFVVLYNLTNINVSERMRELSTIKVLGFYDNEVSAYVYRENIVLTVIGVLVGLVLGVFLAQFVISTVETDIVTFNRSIKPLSYLFSGVLTLAFSAIVNFVIHFKLKKINMVEALKSAE